MLYRPNNTILLERINDYRNMKKKLRYKQMPYRINYRKYKNSSFYSIENTKDNSNISNNNYKNIENYYKQKNNNFYKLKKFGKYISQISKFIKIIQLIFYMKMKDIK